MTEAPMARINPTAIDNLPLETKLELVEAIWDSIAESPDTVEIPTWHKPLLDESLRNLIDEPANQTTWAQVKKRLSPDK